MSERIPKNWYVMGKDTIVVSINYTSYFSGAILQKLGIDVEKVNEDRLEKAFLLALGKSL